MYFYQRLLIMNYLKILLASILPIAAMLLASCGGPKPCESFKDCLEGEVCGSLPNKSPAELYCQEKSECSSFDKPLCNTPSSKCLKVDSAQVCGIDAVSGCMVDQKITCNSGSSCLANGGKEQCTPTCTSTKDCEGGLACRPIPNYSQSHCSAAKEYLTVEAMCVLYIQEATIPAGNWDNVTSGAKSKADPYVVIKLSSGKELKTETFQNSTNPIWNFATPKSSFAEFARMNITLWDSDKGQFFKNKDDVVGSWGIKNNRWLIKNAKEKSIGLANGTVRLYITIKCD